MIYLGTFAAIFVNLSNLMYMKKPFLLSLSVFIYCAIIISLAGCREIASSKFEYYSLSDNASQQEIVYASKIKQFCETLLNDPSSFDDMLTDSMVDLQFEKIESPDKGLKIYTWYNGREDEIDCHNSLYQGYRNGKFRSGILEDWTMKPKKIYQVWSKGEPVYLVRVQSEYEGDIYEGGLKACCLDKKGRLLPTKVFPNLNYPYYDEEEEYTDYLYFDEYNILPPSAFYKGGWAEDFFFSNDGKELYMPYVKTEMDMHCSYGVFYDMYHHYSWDGESFLHYGDDIVFNPKLNKFIDEDELMWEFPLGQSNIRIDKYYTGTYRYLAWKKDKMFSAEPDLEIHDGWYHEVKHEFHFENDNYEYVFNTETLHLKIYHSNLPIADYKIDVADVFSNM